jgi:putative membrane protein
VYLWLKALHVVAVMSWMVGVFYAFPLYGYHIRVRAKPDVAAALTLIERRLLRIVALPSGAVAVALGAWMLVRSPSLLAAPWFQWKLGAAALMIAFHAYCEHIGARLRRGEFPISERTARLMHVAPTILLMAIVALVIVRPAL